VQPSWGSYAVVVPTRGSCVRDWLNTQVKHCDHEINKGKGKSIWEKEWDNKISKMVHAKNSSMKTYLTFYTKMKRKETEHWSNKVIKRKAANRNTRVRVAVLTAAGMKMAVFWVVRPCSLEAVYWCFRGACCVHHQGERKSPKEIFANTKAHAGTMALIHKSVGYKTVDVWLWGTRCWN
jgi:hypothetical protein